MTNAEMGIWLRMAAEQCAASVSQVITTGISPQAFADKLADAMSRNPGHQHRPESQRMIAALRAGALNSQIAGILGYA